MKRSTQKALVITIAVVFVAALFAGCEEQNLADTKKSRLVATENLELKEQLTQYDVEIEEQKSKLDKCLKEKELLKQRTQKSIKEQVDGVLKGVMDINARLQAENKDLKEKLKQLEKSLHELQPLTTP